MLLCNSNYGFDFPKRKIKQEIYFLVWKAKKIFFKPCKFAICYNAHIKIYKKCENYCLELVKGANMTNEAKQRYDEKIRRIYTAIDHKEPDRIPINVSAEIFAVMEAGFTIKECIYDKTM